MDWFLSDFNLQAGRFFKSFEPESAPGMTLIYGPAGVGKSFWLNLLSQRLEREECICVDALSFSRQYAFSAQNDKLSWFRQRYRRTPLFMLDDLQNLVGKAQTIQELQYTYEYIRQNGGKLIAACRADSLKLDFLGQHLMSRFLSGVVIPIRRPQAEEIERFILDYAYSLRLIMEQGVPALIAGRADNLREAKRLLREFIKFAEQQNEALGTECFTEYWRTESQIRSQALNPENIIRISAEIMNLAPEDLTGPSQKSAANEARQLAIYSLREMLSLSFPAIGAYFNRRHSTIIMSYKRIRETLDQNQPLIKRYQELRSKFKIVEEG